MGKALPWILAAVLIGALVWTGSEMSGARAEAERERGKVVELIRQREASDSVAAEARASAQRDSLAMIASRRYADSVASVARRTAQNAHRTAMDAEARVRATLDSLGASTGALDSLVVAHATEIEAKDTEIKAIASELTVTRSYAETLVLALDAADERSLALAAERDSYRRQAEAWSKVAQPGFFGRLKHELGRAVVYGGVGFVAGRL